MKIKKCEYCSCEYTTKAHNRKYCSGSCKSKKKRETPKGIARMKRISDARKQTYECGMCGKEYLGYIKLNKGYTHGVQKRVCSSECLRHYNEYMNKVLAWD